MNFSHLVPSNEGESYVANLPGQNETGKLLAFVVSHKLSSNRVYQKNLFLSLSASYSTLLRML